MFHAYTVKFERILKNFRYFLELNKVVDLARQFGLTTGVWLGVLKFNKYCSIFVLFGN